MEGSRTQGRSRTPWDAGGYSLPITSRPTATPPSQIVIHSDERQQADSPISPKHKLSDSRSSLSSFTSSINSTTHSRFSSMSTVASSHTLNSSSTDIVSPKSTPLEMASPSNPTLPLDASSNEARTTINAPSDNLDTLATIAENRLSPSSEQQSQGTNSMSDSTEKGLATKRPSSPSDAILIKRTAVPTLRLDTGSHEINRLEQHQQT